MIRGILILIVGTLLLGGVGLVVGGAALRDRVLPSAAAALMRTGEPAALLKHDPRAEDHLIRTTQGLEARGPIAALKGNRPVFIDTVLTGRKQNLAQEIPATLTTIRPILGCNFTPPMEGSVVGHATAGSSGIRTAITTYSDTHLAAAVQDLVDAYRQDGASTEIDAGRQAYEAYDVAVTETGAPVYLVLEQSRGNRIWNVHLAPGARIERVILLGGDQAGIANVDPLVPVEVMLNDGLSACGATPAYAVSSEQSAEPEPTVSAPEAYDLWFATRFGVAASDSRIGWDKGAVSLIGEVPSSSDQRVAWSPIAGAEIRTTQDTFFEIAGQGDASADFAARVKAIATSFAYGNLEHLRQGADF